MHNLEVTQPGEEMGSLSSLPMLGADFAAGSLAGKGLLAGSRALGLPAVGRFLTGAGEGLAKLPSLATSGALQGWLSAKINSLFGQETPSGTAALTGAATNALTGGLAPALFGNRISQEAAQRAQALRAGGFDVRTGNVPGSSFAARLAGKLTGASRPDAQELTRQVMRSVGSDADTLSGATLAAAKARLQGAPGNPATGTAPIQGEFDRIAASAAPITWSSAPSLRPELADILHEAHTTYGLQQNNPDEMRRVYSHMQNIVDGVNSGGISGPQLQAMTNMNSDLSRLANGATAGNFLGTRLKRALYNAAGEADPDAARALALARNQYRNISMLEPSVDRLTDANGIVNPAAVAARIRGEYENYQGASQAAASAGQPSDLGLLGEAGQNFGQQGVLGRPTLPSLLGLSTGAGVLGAEELAGGFPAIEALAQHPLLSLGASAGMLGGVIPMGALQNTGPMTSFLLSRASRGAGPLFAGSNPLVGLGVASQGHLAPPPVPHGDPRTPDSNWSNWLRGQSFLESPSGAASSKSSAKGYFQFLDGTAKRALAAGLPNPQEGDYSSQAAATRAYIQKFYPSAASAISQGDFPTAAGQLAGEWPSLPGGSQQQDPSQYAQWNKILQAQ
jgi:hypothetical protein